MKRTINVTLIEYLDGDTGGLYVMPDDRQLQQRESEVDKIEQEAEQNRSRANTKDKREFVDEQFRLVEKMREAIKSTRDIRDELLESGRAKRQAYTLSVPSYGAYLEAENSAKEIDPKKGSVTVDQSVLAKELLPKCVEGMSPKEVLDLDVVVYRALWDRLYAALFPDPAMLPFSLQPRQPI